MGAAHLKNAGGGPGALAGAGGVSLSWRRFPRAALLRTAVRPPSSPASQAAFGPGAHTGAPANASAESRTLSVTPLESGLVLGLLNALFLAFVLVQLRYLFGGAALVETTVDLSYAEYARRGFFEGRVVVQHPARVYYGKNG